MPWESFIAVIFQAGNRIIINPLGMFVYNGGPTLGNLLATITNQSGTDKFGNPFVPGITIYASGGKQFVNINDVPPPTINIVTGAGSENEPSTLFADITNTALANEFMTLFLTGPSSSFDDQRAVIQLISSRADGSKLALGSLFVFQGNTPLSNPVNWTADTGIWHTMSVFLNGWAKTGGGPACRYRITAFNELEVQGEVNSSGASAAQFFQLPTGYRPTVQGLFQMQSATVTDTGQFFGTCPTSGQLTVNGNPAAGPNFLFEGTFPLD